MTGHLTVVRRSSNDSRIGSDGIAAGEKKEGLSGWPDEVTAPKVLMAGIDEKGQHVLAIERLRMPLRRASLSNADTEDAASNAGPGVSIHCANDERGSQNDLHLGNFLLPVPRFSALIRLMRYRSHRFLRGKVSNSLPLCLRLLPEEYLVWHSEFLCAYSEIRGWTYNSDMLDSVRQLALCRRKKRLPHQLRKNNFATAEIFLSSNSLRIVPCSTKRALMQTRPGT